MVRFLGLPCSRDEGSLFRLDSRGYAELLECKAVLVCSRGFRIPVKVGLQGHLAHKKQPPPRKPPHGPMHQATEGSKGGAVSFERGTLACFERCGARMRVWKRRVQDPLSIEQNLALIVLYVPLLSIAHLGESRPDSGLGFQVKVLQTL